MANLSAAIAASRGADKLRFKTGMTAAEAIRIGLDKEKALRDLLSALDAARGEAVLYGRIDSESGEIAMKDGVYQVAEFFSSEFPVALYLAPPAAGAVPAVDWRELYRIQTAMRYMDNNPGLTRDHAFSWADQDIAAMLAAANKENNNERQ